MKSLFRRLLKPHLERRNMAALYGRVMAQARQTMFFEKFGLPDTFESRFEILALHMFLVLERLKKEGVAARPLMQALTEYMVDDLDRSLREMGIGDVGVAKRMKKLISDFYGRVLAYEKAARAADHKELLRTLDRNLFAALDTDLTRLKVMQAYIQKQQAALAAQPLSIFLEGKAEYADSGLS